MSSHKSSSLGLEKTQVIMATSKVTFQTGSHRGDIFAVVISPFTDNNTFLFTSISGKIRMDSFNSL